jgi:CRP-like cAMP-binding protein
MERADFVKAVNDSSFFHAMAEEERVALARLGTLHDHLEGEVLFRPRDAPSALYLVVDGVAEINRREHPDGELEPVAYVGAGATLAASKVITGTPFAALARFPEGGQTLQWSRTVILRKLYASRAFSMQYLQNIARRLEGSFENVGGYRGTKLGGRLDHFDLATILQTVVESGSSGLLEVADDKGTRYGSIFTEDRHIGPMLCGTLSGPEAFFEILVTPPERGTFTFSSVATPRPADRRYTLAPLLFEAARMQDEFRRFRGEIAGDHPLRTTGRQLEFFEGSDPELIEQIWRAVAAQSAGWESLAQRLPYSRSQVALAVRDMLLAGLLMLEIEPEVAGGAG